MRVDIDLNAIDYELPSYLLHCALVYGCSRSTLYFNFIPSSHLKETKEANDITHLCQSSFPLTYSLNLSHSNKFTN